jgi:phenylacetic acid degradation operon negative regulatory protein
MLAPLLAHWRERPQRTWSVVITVFGDAIVPRGGSVRLATLLELFAAMGIDAGAVRTAMSRLVADGWTERTRLGRHSSYRLIGRGHSTFAAAAERIYAGHAAPWNGHFSLVLDPQDRTALAARGYGQAAPGLWVAPGPIAAPAEPITLDATLDAGAARKLAARAWPLDRLAASFARFNDAFAPLPAWHDPAPLEAMIARTLLIHDYRRIVLHGPALPAAVLPQDWPGTAARTLCAAAYAAVLPTSEEWLTEQGLPPAGADLAQRFAERVTEYS